MTAPYSDPEVHADDWEDFLEWKAEAEQEMLENPIPADWVVSFETDLPF